MANPFCHFAASAPALEVLVQHPGADKGTRELELTTIIEINSKRPLETSDNTGRNNSEFTVYRSRPYKYEFCI